MPVSAKKSQENSQRREREAARIRLKKMKNTAGMKSNFESFRELEKLAGSSLFSSFLFLGGQEKPRVVSVASRGSCFWNPLAKFGLRLKDDNDDDDGNNDDDVIGNGDRLETSCRVYTDIDNKESKKQKNHMDIKNEEKSRKRKNHTRIDNKEESKKRKNHMDIENGESKKQKNHMNIENGESKKRIGSLDYANDYKALHAAMLRKRYSKIIYKAQQKTLFC
ncbi:hypothetical protein ACOSQ4_013872 [Xanthoceras sorbifolium]